MAQSPLAPPPGTKDAQLSRWLFLLWKRLTATGQILWSSIVPGTSADVAAVVTDETGSPGSLVFSGNPTLQGLTVEDAAFTSRGITDNATATALTIDSSGRSLFGYGTSTPVGGINSTLQVNATSAVANFAVIRNITPGSSGSFLYLASTRGAAGTNTALQIGDGLGSVFFAGADGTNIINAAAISVIAEAAVSTGVIPGRMTFYTYNSGVNTEAMRISTNQVVTLGGAGETPALKVTPVASQARWVEVTGATSSGNPTIGTSAGSLALNPAGQGVSVVIPSGGASTVNYMSIGGAVAGSSPSIITGGSDANVNAYLNTQGTGAWLINTGGVRQVQINHTASADRYITLTGSNGGNPTIGVSAGGLSLSAQTLIGTNSTDYIAVTGGTGNVILSAAGGSANVQLSYTPKGTGGHVFNASDGGLQLFINPTTSANRYIALTGSNGGNPKIGTSAGQLTLGTGAALATSATEGYVCIPTCAGAPTGVPAGAGAGNLPLIYDTTNNKLYAYNGAWKATAALT